MEENATDEPSAALPQQKTKKASRWDAETAEKIASTFTLRSLRLCERQIWQQFQKTCTRCANSYR